MKEILLNQNQFFEVDKITNGSYYPLSGFMTEKEFYSVIDNYILPDGNIFSIPIFLDVTKEDANNLKINSSIKLLYDGNLIGEILVESIFSCDKKKCAKNIYGTDDIMHPGVNAFYKTKEIFIGGKVTIKKKLNHELSRYELTPSQTKNIFKEKKWNTIAAFHTRNPPHCAHEWLQRMALESYDGLLIHPILGQKKPGDFLPMCVIKGYELLISKYYPLDRVMLSALSTSGRYAGPREALFHALIRRNYGCTHIIIGRDHAGVGNYYGMYDSQNLCTKYEDELGIKIIKYKEPYFCWICNTITNKNACKHITSDPNSIEYISGSKIRSLFSDGLKPPRHVMRPEVVEAIQSNNMFVSEYIKN
jgi:sulfate adenylyltransferase